MEIGIGLGQGPDGGRAAAAAARQAAEALPQADITLAFGSAFLDQEAVHKGLCAVVDPASLIGCSSFAEITPAGVTQGSVAVLRLKLPGARVTFADAAVGEAPARTGERLAQSLPPAAGEGMRLGLLATAVSTGYENDALRALERAQGRFPVFGGVGCGRYDLGMGHPDFWRRHQYLGARLDANGARLAVLDLPKEGPRPAFGFAHGWEPVGPQVKLTRCKGHRVYEIDGVPVMDFYRQMLGAGHSDDFFKLLIQRYGFALLLEGEYEGSSLLKLPVRVDFKEGAIELYPAEDLAGRRARLIYASRQGLIEGARQAALTCKGALEGQPPGMVLMVSCCTRKTILHSRVEHELAAVREVFGPGVPVFGFYSGGEIAPFLSRFEETIDAKRRFAGSFYHTTTVGLLAFGAKKGARPLAAPLAQASGAGPDPAQLSRLLSESEEVLDQAEVFLSNLSRKSYRDGELLRRQNDIIHHYTPHSVFSRICENVSNGVYEVVDAEFSGCFMFLDVKGFTSFSEKHPAAEVVKALNELFDPATRLIYENDGDVDKFIGDSIFAAFRDAESALRCGRRLLQLFARLKKEGGPFSVRIGAHLGRAVRANVGSPERREYTYIGDGVNLAQRLEANCTPGRMLISEALFKKACVPFDQVERKRVVVKGKRRPVVCYECQP